MLREALIRVLMFFGARANRLIQASGYTTVSRGWMLCSLVDLGVHLEFHYCVSATEMYASCALFLPLTEQQTGSTHFTCSNSIYRSNANNGITNKPENSRDRERLSVRL